MEHLSYICCNFYYLGNDIEVGWKLIDFFYIKNIQNLVWVYKLTQTPTNKSIK